MFENAANSVEKNDPKATNLELAARGQAFSSFRRNFDYLSKNNSPSTWKRDNLHNINVEDLLIACGLTEEEANEGVEDEIPQVYKQNHWASEMGGKKIGTDGGKFAVDTIQGMDLFDLVLKSVNSSIEARAKVNVKCRWTNGDTYVTEAFTDEREQPFFRVEKTLDFSESVGIGDNLVMTVKSYLSLDHKETVSSKEVYFRTYNIENGQESVLSTGQQRVPG